MGNFVELTNEEMMNVDGGARSRADRIQAGGWARANRTSSQVRETVKYVGPIFCTLAAPLCPSIASGLVLGAIGQGCGLVL